MQSLCSSNSNKNIKNTSYDCHSVLTVACPLWILCSMSEEHPTRRKIYSVSTKKRTVTCWYDRSQSASLLVPATSTNLSTISTTRPTSPSEREIKIYCLDCACNTCTRPFQEKNEWIKTEEGYKICHVCYSQTLCNHCYILLHPNSKQYNPNDNRFYCFDCICVRCLHVFGSEEQGQQTDKDSTRYVMFEDKKYCQNCICASCNLPLSNIEYEMVKIGDICYHRTCQTQCFDQCLLT